MVKFKILFHIQWNGDMRDAAISITLLSSLRYRHATDTQRERTSQHPSHRLEQMPTEKDEYNLYLPLSLTSSTTFNLFLFTCTINAYVIQRCRWLCHKTIKLLWFSDRFLERKEFRQGDLVIVVNMNNRQLKRHDTLPTLTTQTDLGSPDSCHDGLSLPPDTTAIADPQIFMLSEAIKQMLDSSFTGLQSTLTAISTQMERIASRPSPFHAHAMGPAVGSRLGHLPLLVLECPLGISVPLLQQTAPHRHPANRWGGGGGGSSRSQGKHTPGRWGQWWCR